MGILFSIISFEKWIAASRRSLSVNRSMIPILLPRLADIGVPEVISSMEAFAPAILGTLCVPPAPGSKPK